MKLEALLCIGGPWDGKFAEDSGAPFLKVFRHKQIKTPNVIDNYPEISKPEYDIYWHEVFTLEGKIKRCLWRHEKLTIEEMFDKLLTGYKGN